MKKGLIVLTVLLSLSSLAQGPRGMNLIDLDFDSGLERARKEDRLLLVHFTDSLGYGDDLFETTSEVSTILEDEFVCIELDLTDEAHALFFAYNDFLEPNPASVFISQQGDVIDFVYDYRSLETFKRRLDRFLNPQECEQFKLMNKVIQGSASEVELARLIYILHTDGEGPEGFVDAYLETRDQLDLECNPYDRIAVAYSNGDLNESFNQNFLTHMAFISNIDEELCYIKMKNIFDFLENFAAEVGDKQQMEMYVRKLYPAYLTLGGEDSFSLETLMEIFQSKIDNQ